MKRIESLVTVNLKSDTDMLCSEFVGFKEWG